MTTEERREKILRAETAILTLEERACEKASATETIGLAQDAFEAAHAELVVVSDEFKRLSSEIEVKLEIIRQIPAEVHDKLAGLDQLEARFANLRSHLTSEFQQRSDGLFKKMEDVGEGIDSVSKDLKGGVSALQASLGFDPSSPSQSVNMTLDTIASGIAKIEKDALDQAENNNNNLAGISRQTKDNSDGLTGISRALTRALYTGAGALLIVTALLILLLVKSR